MAMVMVFIFSCNSGNNDTCKDCKPLVYDSVTYYCPPKPDSNASKTTKWELILKYQLDSLIPAQENYKIALAEETTEEILYNSTGHEVHYYNFYKYQAERREWARKAGYYDRKIKSIKIK